MLAIEHASFTSPWTKEMYLAEFENAGVSFFYLAKTPLGEIIGFCSFWRVLDELHINNLAVAPEHRRVARGDGAPGAECSATARKWAPAGDARGQTLQRARAAAVRALWFLGRGHAARVLHEPGRGRAWCCGKKGLP